MPRYYLSEIEDVEPEYLWPGWILKGLPSILFGEQGTGKTQLALSLVKSVCMGLPFPDGTVPPTGIVLYIEGENGRLELRRRAKNMGIDVTENNTNFVLFTPFGKEANFDFFYIDDGKKKGGFNQLVEMVGDVKPDWVIIDPLVAFHKGNEINAVEMRRLITIQTTIAQQFNCAWTCVFHPNKNQLATGIYRVRGSGDFTASARNVLELLEKPNAPKTGGELILRMAKINNSIFPDDLVFTIDDMGVVHWTGETIPRGRVDDRTQRDKAGDWLRAVLHNGSIDSTKLKEMAYDSHFSWATVSRAMRINHIQAHKKDGEKYGNWYYTLPELPF